MIELFTKNIKNKVNIAFVLFLISLSVIAWGVIRCMIGQDPLQFKIPILDFDLWSVSHIIVFFIVTYIYPKEWLFIYIMGVSWELFEYWCGAANPDNIKFLFGNCKLMELSDKYDSNWWYGKKTDLIANAIGVFGALFVKKYLRL